MVLEQKNNFFSCKGERDVLAAQYGMELEHKNLPIDRAIRGVSEDVAIAMLRFATRKH